MRKNHSKIVCIKLVHISYLLKNTPTCFDHYSDHLQGARRFLVKVTEFKI